MFEIGLCVITFDPAQHAIRRMAVTWCFAYFVLLGSIISEEVLSRMTVCFGTLLKLFYMACHLSGVTLTTKDLSASLRYHPEIEEDWRRQTVQSGFG